MKRWKKIVLFPVMLLCFASTALALEVPQLNARVNDYAKILTKPQEMSLEKKLEEHENQTSNQVAVLTIKSLEGENLEDFSMRVAQIWGLGHKGKDNGVLILIAKEDRKIRIEVGYGLEGVIPDGVCGRIIREEMTPQFKKNNFYEGINSAVDKIFLAIKGEYKAEPQKTAGSSSSTEAYLLVMCIVMLIAGFFGMAHPVIGGIVGGIGTIVVTKWMFNPSGTILFFAAVAGFIVGAIAKYILEVIAEGDFDGEGSWSTGGGGSSGDSGFGGFGGGFGGGGASGGW